MEAATKRICVKAYAKINLTLDILGKREDGYHDLAMVMQSLSLHDDVELKLDGGEGIRCVVEGAELAGDGTNLAVKAAKAYCAAADMAPEGIAIAITKRIPMAAGMAGGSADAAATLRGLETLLGKLGEARLYDVGASVGSDVPFCLMGGTALAEGRGERLTALKAAPKMPVVVCKPAFPISTPVLFKRSDNTVITKRPDTAAMLRAIEAGDAAAVCANVCNVFEEVLEEEQAEVMAIKETLLRCGTMAAQMTGSGPTVFGLFKDLEQAEAACRMLSERYAETYLSEFV